MPLVDGVPTPVDVLDEGTAPRIWQAKHGISQQWADKLVNQMGVSLALPLSYDRVNALTGTTPADS